MDPSNQVDEDESVMANKILTVGVYVFWNYALHLSYWHFEDSWLHYYSEHGLLFQLYGIHILHIITICFYLLAVFKSPGEVESIPNVAPNIGHPKYCELCKVTRPRMSKHCYQCKKCIIKYDHHCLFTANCVGADNHCIFLLYLLIEDVFLLWSFPMSIDAMIYGITHWNHIGFIQMSYRCLCCLLIGFTLIGLLLLLSFHLYLIQSNMTTYVYIKKYGFCSNEKQGSYDQHHFDIDKDLDLNFVTKMMHFMCDSVPLEWRISGIDQMVSHQSAVSYPNGRESRYNTKAVRRKVFEDKAGVGCVPLPSFKLD